MFDLIEAKALVEIKVSKKKREEEDRKIVGVFFSLFILRAELFSSNSFRSVTAVLELCKKEENIAIVIARYFISQKRKAEKSSD